MNELLAYWRDYPPTHVMVAAYLLGGNPRHGERRSAGHAGNLLTLKQLVASAGGGIKRELPDCFRKG